MQWSKTTKPDLQTDDSEKNSDIKFYDRNSLILFTNLFQRDFYCWLTAIYKGWIFFLILPIVLGTSFYFFRMFTTPKVYQSSCGLLRQEPVDFRTSGLPPGYVSIQRSIIVNMMQGRTVLEQTLLRLNLSMSYGQLFYMTSVLLPEKNSNYFIITATSEEPDLSAKIANTMAEVFIEDYKKIIRSNVELIHENRLRNQVALNTEISEIQKRLKDIYAENDISSFDQEESNNNQRILALEDRMVQSQTKSLALKQRLNELQARLSQVPEDTVVYKETNLQQDSALENEISKLHELMEIYTDDNPKLQQKKMLVQRLLDEKKEKARITDAETLSKVVTGKNMEYINLQFEVVKTKGEVATLESEIQTMTENLVVFKQKRELLSRLAPQLRSLEDKYSQKKDLVLKEELTLKELSLFLERSYSDISVQEPARPTSMPMPRKLTVFGGLGFLLGLFFAALIVLGKEAINLTTRSQVDLEKALRLPALAVIPELSQKHRADFYGALQMAVSRIDDMLKKSARQPSLVTIAPFSNNDLNPPLFAELYEFLTIRKDWRYIIIKPVSEEDSIKVAPYLINDYLYHLSDVFPKVGKDRTLYFKLDDLAFISPPSKIDLEKFRDSITNCDIIIWELFEFELHRQLFTEIATVADISVVPLKYAKTSKLTIFRMLRQLYAQDVENVLGLLYGIASKYYRRSL